MLAVRRIAGRVKYQIRAVPSDEAAQDLIRALRRTFQHNPSPVETVFKLATAFTQPRRIEIVRALKQEAQCRRQLQAATGISLRALARHLRKLEARGFVVYRRGIYSVTESSEGLGHALVRLATGER